MFNSTCKTMDKNIVLPLSSIVALILISSAASDMAADRDKCAEQVVGLATCLPYVGGDAKTPTIDCCTGLEQVLKESKECLCVLVRDRNDPNLGIKINATLALGLPQKCHSPNADVSKCPALLHLAPNSPDAKVFEDFVKGTKASNTSSNVVADPGKGSNSSTIANEKSEGSKRNWFGIEMAVALTIAALLPLH